MYRVEISLERHGQSTAAMTEVECLKLMDDFDPVYSTDTFPAFLQRLEETAPAPV